jgi:sodium-dependent dicarboxylate transporter 2/3/5
MEQISKTDEIIENNNLKSFICLTKTTLIGTIILFYVLINYLPFATEINQGLALLACAAILWLTEAVHISITALMIPIAAVFLGILDTNSALSGFAHPTIYLFFGGFALAAAIHSQGIDKFISEKLLYLARGQLKYACILLFFATAALSMWISNTATTTIMLPLALGLLSQIDKEKNLSTYVFVLLGIGYSANIGGIGTVLGSPPNAIAASQAGISFTEWLEFGLIAVALMLPAMLISLYLIFKPDLSVTYQYKHENQKLSASAKLTVLIFVITALCWIQSKQISAALGGIAKFDTIIALTSAITLNALGLVSWKKIQQTTEWSVLILFGGGITLSGILAKSGTSAFLANAMTSTFGSTSVSLFVLALILFVIILTEFASNTASATLLVPIFASVAESLGVSTVMMCAIIGIAANCAFMLPVGTPPNAIVYGSGYIKQSNMIKAGIIINILATIIIYGIAETLWSL